MNSAYTKNMIDLPMDIINIFALESEATYCALSLTCKSFSSMVKNKMFKTHFKYTIEQYEDVVVYKYNGQLHRNNGPACMCIEDVDIKELHDLYTVQMRCIRLYDKMFPKAIWFYKALIHRDGGPAVILKDGTEIWYSNDTMHRKDGPAYMNYDRQVWYLSDRLHRKGGPAVIRRDCEKWFRRGYRHRKGGPAVIKPGVKKYYRWGDLHREDGPAVETKYEKKWYINGRMHREDGPAVITTDGEFQWRIEGDLHRDDGPAVIYNDGYLEWWINGVLIGADYDAQYNGDDCERA